MPVASDRMWKRPTVTTSTADARQADGNPSRIEEADDAGRGAPGVSVRRLRDGAAGNGNQANQQLFLSVLLLLVAFFAVLVSMSDVEEQRAEKVLRSLEGTFNPGYRIISVIEGASTDLSAVDLPSNDVQVARLRRSIALHLESETIDADAFRFFMRPDELFDEPRPILKIDRLVMLRRLANSLGNPAPGSATQASMILEGPIDRLSGVDRAAMTKRLDILRKTMRRFGAPMERIAVGLRMADSYRWVFEIDSRDRPS